MKCLICQRECHRPEGHEMRDGTVHYEAHDAICCRANGNWGSTLWDPLSDSEHLQFMICDDCMRDRAHLVRTKYSYRRYIEEDRGTLEEYDAREVRELRRQAQEQIEKKAKAVRKAAEDRAATKDKTTPGGHRIRNLEDTKKMDFPYPPDEDAQDDATSS